MPCDPASLRRSGALAFLVFAILVFAAPRARAVDDLATGTWITTKASLGGTVDFALVNMATGIDASYNWQIILPPGLTTTDPVSGSLFLSRRDFAVISLDISVPHGTVPQVFSIPFLWNNVTTGATGSGEARVFVTPFDAEHPTFRPFPPVSHMDPVPVNKHCFGGCIADSAGAAIGWRSPEQPPPPPPPDFVFSTGRINPDPGNSILFNVSPTTGTVDILVGPPADIHQMVQPPAPPAPITINEITVSLDYGALSGVAYARYIVIYIANRPTPVELRTWGQVKSQAGR